MTIDITALRHIGNIYRASNSFTDYVAKNFNLEKSQYQFLVRIGENPGITQQELSVNLQVDKGTVLKAVRKLMDKGFVKRTNNTQDQRKYNLHLTQNGHEIFIFIMKEELFVVDLCLNNLTTKEQRQLSELLERVNQNITNLWVDVRDDKLEQYIQVIQTINYTELGS